MKTETINIAEGQYFTDIYDFIPENAIIKKTLPGIGATYCEIVSKRNSIIVEPNVPVIEGKMKKHPSLLGVIEGINTEHVVDYLKGDVEYKKIITTPESYHKVRRAFKQRGIKYFDEYFLLIDECERMYQDIDYRKTIDAPMEDFWKFKKRSFISATPIPVYPKAFKENRFKILNINPDFWYHQHITIYHTRNVLATVKELLSEVLKDKSKIEDCYCYFINSADMIHCIIKDLDIKDISNIYCAEGKTADKLKSFNYENVYSSLDHQLNSFNFFTSRFYSAVDIEIDLKPHVVIVTDVKFAQQSMVFPDTDAIQIAGRFRNGIKSMTHITNTDETIQVKSLVKAYREIQDARKAYDQLGILYKTATTKHQKAVFKQAMEKVDFANYLTSDGELNWFRVLNSVLDQMLVNTYHDRIILQFGYFQSKYFYSGLKDYTSHRFEDNRHFRRSGTTKLERRKEIIESLEGVDMTVIDDKVRNLEWIKNEDPLIYAAIIDLGIEYIKEVNYREKDLWLAVIKKAAEKGETNHPTLDAIVNIFKVNFNYHESEAKVLLQEIYDEYDLEVTAKATDLEDYFELSPRKTVFKNGKYAKGFTIIKSKFKAMDPGQISNNIDPDKKCPGGFEIS